MNELKVRDAVDVILADMDVSDATRTSYRSALRAFVDHVHEAEGKLNEQVVRSFRDRLIAEGKSPGTVNQYLAAVRAAFAAAGGANPAAGVKRVTVGRGFSRDVLTAAEARRVVDSIVGDGLRKARDRALVNLLLRAGLRLCEVVRADVGDLTTRHGTTILWVQGKGRTGKDEYVVLTDAALDPITDYLLERQYETGPPESGDPLFASTSNRNRGGRLTTRAVRSIVTRALEAAGVKTDRVTAHSTRHTAATIALSNGASIRSVQKMLRHSSVKTTEAYAHDLERLDSGAEGEVRF